MWNVYTCSMIWTYKSYSLRNSYCWSLLCEFSLIDVCDFIFRHRKCLNPILPKSAAKSAERDGTKSGMLDTPRKRSDPGGGLGEKGTGRAATTHNIGLNSGSIASVADVGHKSPIAARMVEVNRSPILSRLAREAPANTRENGGLRTSGRLLTRLSSGRVGRPPKEKVTQNSYWCDYKPWVLVLCLQTEISEKS